MKLYVSVFLIVILSSYSKAQDSIVKIIKQKSPIPAEILVGNNRLYYQMIINRNISENNKLGFLNISSYTADNKNDITKNEYFSSTIIYYNIYKGISVNTGGTFNSSEGIKPYLGLQYMYSNKTISLLYFPSYYFIGYHKITNLAMIEFKPKLNKKLSIYSRLQMTYSQNIEKNLHVRSYLYGRLGLTYNKFTLGAGLNFDWYGEKKSLKENYGAFFKVNL